MDSEVQPTFPPMKMVRRSSGALKLPAEKSIQYFEEGLATEDSGASKSAVAYPFPRLSELLPVSLGMRSFAPAANDSLTDRYHRALKDYPGQRPNTGTDRRDQSNREHYG